MALLAPTLFCTCSSLVRCSFHWVRANCCSRSLGNLAAGTHPSIFLHRYSWKPCKSDKPSPGLGPYSHLIRKSSCGRLLCVMSVGEHSGKHGVRHLPIRLRPSTRAFPISSFALVHTKIASLEVNVGKSVSRICLVSFERLTYRRI